jgi:regulatory protein
VVDELAQIGLQDDARFAREWTRARVARLNGPLKVRRELREKGVATSTVEAVVEEAYGGGRERDLATRAARKHSPALRGRAPEGRARTMYSYLVRRGFTPALASELAREEMHR